MGLILGEGCGCIVGNLHSIFSVHPNKNGLIRIVDKTNIITGV